MISLSQLDIDGVRGISSAVAEKSVEMEAVGGPAGWKLSGVAFGVAGDRGEKGASTEHRAVNEEIKIIGRGCITSVQISIESQVQGVAVVEADRSKSYFRHGAVAEYNAGIVDVAISGETIFVELAEVHIST